jgi:hypothetical protein
MTTRNPLMETEITRPSITKDEHLKYLDKLRLSGVTNMFGSGRYLAKTFGMKSGDANTIVAYWMESFEERHP